MIGTLHGDPAISLILQDCHGQHDFLLKSYKNALFVFADTRGVEQAGGARFEIPLRGCVAVRLSRYPILDILDRKCE